jgi:SAM-dependent methyltransferase
MARLSAPSSRPKRDLNVDRRTVEGFGREWAAYDQTALASSELEWMFDSYFSIFPFDDLPSAAEGFDLGCGSGRWADLVLPRVGLLHCIDPSERALEVARRRLSGRSGVAFHQASADTMPIPDSSQDFGYSLGVLHHVPSPADALKACVRKLKPGAPFLLYLYYDFDIRPGWFKSIWRGTDVARRAVSRTPFPVRRSLTTAIAAAVYWPLARLARAAERNGRDVGNFPLSTYRNASFYTMRTDALDRFGTLLEHRFSRDQIQQMMKAAGLADIVFSDHAPFWIACGRRTRSSR